MTLANIRYFVHWRESVLIYAPFAVVGAMFSIISLAKRKDTTSVRLDLVTVPSSVLILLFFGSYLGHGGYGPRYLLTACVLCHLSLPGVIRVARENRKLIPLFVLLLLLSIYVQLHGLFPDLVPRPEIPGALTEIGEANWGV